MPVDWSRKYGPLTTQQWAIAGGVVGLFYFEYRRRKMAAASSSSSSAGSPTLDTGTYDAGYGAGYSSGFGAGGGGGALPATGGTPATTGDGSSSGSSSSGPPAPSGSPAPTTGGSPGVGAPPALGPGPNRYSLGQVVNAATGERIVQQVFSPVFGWLNVTNQGGIYTGGGGQPGQSISRLPNQGSYLGYVAQRYGVGTPGARQELALHGQFGQSALSLGPGGGSYVLTNLKGEHYGF